MTAHEHSSLPLRDYDHLPLSAVGQRTRSLTAQQLGELLDYERGHANRPAVVQLMRDRLAELDAGAAPSGGSEQAGPDWPEPPSAGSAAGPRKTAPPAFPPPHGTPDQPARPKADRQAP
jgi:hypothetical protein